MFHDLLQLYATVKLRTISIVPTSIVAIHKYNSLRLIRLQVYQGALWSFDKGLYNEKIVNTAWNHGFKDEILY